MTCKLLSGHRDPSRKAPVSANFARRGGHVLARVGIRSTTDRNEQRDVSLSLSPDVDYLVTFPRTLNRSSSQSSQLMKSQLEKYESELQNKSKEVQNNLTAVESLRKKYTY